MKIVALLPIKANSNRVKGKNFRDLAGRPLFRWILDTLLSVDLIDKIVINTDARNLLIDLGLPNNNRILLRDRKKSICGDDVSMNLVLQDDVENIDSDVYLMTHTTNPFLAKNTILDAINIFSEQKENRQVDSLFSVNKLQTRLYSQNGKPLNHDPKNLIPTQKLLPLYEENSNLYLFTKDSFQQTSARIGNKPLLFEINRLESIDIDNPDDWELASALAQYQLHHL